MINEIVFHTSEMLVFLDILRVEHLFGIDRQRIMPDNFDDYKKEVVKGIERLEQRGLLVKDKGINILSQSLLKNIYVLVDPKVLIIVKRRVPSLGEQEFLYYLTADKCIEMTSPEEGLFRIAEIENAELLIARLLEIFNFESSGSANERISLSLEEFNRLYRLIGVSQNETLLSPQDDSAGSMNHLEQLAGSFVSPLFSGSITFCGVTLAKISSVKDFYCLKKADSSWLFELSEKDTNVILGQQISVSECSKKFANILMRYMSESLN